MKTEIKTPTLPESLDSVIVAQLYVNEGDYVQRDQNLIDIETDKVVLEVVSPCDGVVENILVSLNEEVSTEQVLMTVLDSGDTKPVNMPEASIEQTSPEQSLAERTSTLNQRPHTNPTEIALDKGHLFGFIGFVAGLVVGVLATIAIMGQQWEKY